MHPTEQDINLILHTIKNRSAYDFSDYSINSLKRRITRLLHDFQTDVHGLNNRLLTDHRFMEQVVRKITVNTTELFRDPDIWLSLKNDILSLYHDKDEINIWHPGCSTGQEVYSMMILLHEMNLFGKANIYGSDINTEVMEKAMKGIYKYQFNKEYLNNFDRVIHNGKTENEKIHWSEYFMVDEQKDTIEMNRFLNKKPFYKKMDLVKDNNPFNTKFDLIMCRNVIIYFNYNLQNRVLHLFYENMEEDGYLILGRHESLTDRNSELYEKKNQIYMKKPHAGLNGQKSTFH